MHMPTYSLSLPHCCALPMKLVCLISLAATPHPGPSHVGLNTAMANVFDALTSGITTTAVVGTTVAGAKSEHDGQTAGIGNTDERTNLAMKMAVIAVQQSRVALMNCTRSCAIRTDGWLNVIMEATKKSYNAKTTGQKNHGQGTPDHWVGVTVFVKLHKDLAERFLAAGRAGLVPGNQGYPKNRC